MLGTENPYDLKGAHRELAMCLSMSKYHTLLGQFGAEGIIGMLSITSHLSQFGVNGGSQMHGEVKGPNMLVPRCQKVKFLVLSETWQAALPQILGMKAEGQKFVPR